MQNAALRTACAHACARSSARSTRKCWRCTSSTARVGGEPEPEYVVASSPPPPLEDAQESTMEPQVLLHLAAVEEQQPAAADTAETSVPANTPSPAPHVKLELELQYDPSSPPFLDLFSTPLAYVRASKWEILT